jgi:UDP-3-O-[3-hydroxymyristoyl] glucosamine N-acyltransferase
MKQYTFPYGRGVQTVVLPEDHVAYKLKGTGAAPVADVTKAVQKALRRVYPKDALSERVAPYEKVVIVVSDGTRMVYTPQMLDAVIGEGCQIYPQVYVGRGVRIGDNTTLYPGVKIYEGCIVGANCILHAGAVIGADGFGFMPNAAGGFDKIPQLGNVVIEDDVEIGANTCIDRAKTDSTVIRRGVKLDNLIQIGHNVQIGENTVSSAQTGIAGTSKVGRNCFLAGQVGIADHVTIGDRVKVGSKSGLDKDVPDDEIRFGYPALPGMQYHRSAAVFKRLPELAQQVRALEKQLAELTKK